MTGVDVLLSETVSPVEIKFQSPDDAAILVDGHGNQRQDSPLAAGFGVEQEFRIHIRGANHLPGAQIGGADRLIQRYFASHRQSGGAGGGTVTHDLSFENCYACSAGLGDACHPFSDHRHRLTQFQMAHLNLVLRFNDLRQCERVVATGTCLFRIGVAARERSLTCRFLLAESFALRLKILFQRARPTVVFLDDVGGLQQLFKSLLVEDWFVFLVGHDVSCPLPGIRRGQRERTRRPSLF